VTTIEEERLGNATSRAYRIAGFWLLFLACCAIRLLDIGWKSIMHDEALFTYYTYDQLYKSWTYTYLPILHGPASLHLQALIWHLFGATDYTMRLGSALLGVAGFFWVWMLRPWLGRYGVWFALIFYTVSPGIVFYQRFYREDALYLFNSLWIVTSLAWWWRTRKPGWLASAVVGCAVLFCNKESSLFLYFSLFTFLILLVVHDGWAWLMEGKRHEKIDHLLAIPRMPNPLWPTLALGGFVVLCVVFVFEGIRYDKDVTDAIGHDWVLRDVRSIPLALGWSELTAADAPDAGGMREGKFWRLFYGGLFAGLLACFAGLSVLATRRIGQREFCAGMWYRLHAARFHLLAALGLSIFLYFWFFTTGFRSRLGFFEIYSKTWGYWGGQHEWGRIYGPFYQHPLNMAIYEMPSVLIVFAAWVGGLCRARITRVTAMAFFLMIVAVGGFHKLLFSGLEVKASDGTFTLLHIDYLKTLFLAGLALGVVTLAVPRAGRILAPIAFIGLVVFSLAYFHRSEWLGSFGQQLYRGGEPIRLSNRHVDLAGLLEIQFNFDGGSSIALVMILIFFATLYSWLELERGARFRAFLVWWTVTATGAACYAREAVPQIGIHGMLPLLLLAASYLDPVYARMSGPVARGAFIAIFSVAALWNTKATTMLNFFNADDPRERMAYGPTPQDLMAHCEFIMDYHKIAPIRIDPAKNIPTFYVRNNRYQDHKQVRVGVATPGVVWPVRWYLREVEWYEEQEPDRYLKENYEFLFVDQSDLRNKPEIAERYHTFLGSSMRFWLPRQLSLERLTDIWKEWIPGHYLDASPEAVPAYNAKQEWYKVWRYLLFRETFDGGIEGDGNVTGTQYVFCVRKDLY